MKKSDMLISVVASLGVGAATFYTMSKSDKPLNKAVESVTPILTSMTNDGSSQQSLNSSSGNYGNQNNGQTNGDAGNYTNQNKSNDYSSTETMGPYGMS